MKKTKLTIIAFAICSLFASCIQKEEPNSEADIITCILPQEILKADPLIENESIMIMVNKGTNLTAVAPQFTLTKGATIDPASGTTRNFLSPQKYTVTSQDGEWTKEYVVSFVDADLSTQYHFEDTIKRVKYYIFAEKDEKTNKVIMEWASGNGGFAITGAGKTDKDYPTIQSDRGLRGKCAELVTRSTGSIGSSYGIPIAAGNLFIGKFDVASALQNPLKATKLGLPFSNVPTYLIGYYKYKAGEQYTEKGEVVPNKKDICDIFAVFYETDESTPILDGTNKFTHPN
ncbi:MAG: PCMD domain-containing protein, partial [Bacteroidales bacterium]